MKNETRIRLLAAADIPLGLRLCAQNNWNQLEADWRRQLALQPDGCFVAERNGKAIGTACACAFGRDAWINLVLVDRDHRGRGVGTMLLRHVVDWLDDRGVRSIWLDATPLGQPVYAKLGFIGVFPLARWHGVMPTGHGAVTEVEPLLPEDIGEISDIDERATGFWRESLLRVLFAAEPTRMRKVVVRGSIAGFSLCRPGANAWQIGPTEGSPDACAILFADAVHHFAGQKVYVDIPAENSNANDALRTIGFAIQRPFLRMVRGESRDGDRTLFWSSFGPEKG